MPKRNYTPRHCDGTPFRGRPTVAEGYFESAQKFEYFKDFHFGNCTAVRPTNRTVTNGIYMQIGCDLVEAAAKDFPELNALLPQPQYMFPNVSVEKRPKSGILEQLGRMKQQDGLPDSDIVYAALMAVDAKDRGLKSKEIQKAIREIRKAGGVDNWLNNQ